LASAFVRLSALAGVYDIEIPKISMIMSDLITTLIELPDKPKDDEITKIAESIEERVLKGSIGLEKPEELSYYEIYFYPKGNENNKVPLRRVSSAISELIPLVIYLKYLVKPKDLLIIEEPEAHLHPKNQVILAEILAELVKKGVYVLITTHSDYILDKINNIILRHIKEKDESCLSPEEVGVYLFSLDEHLNARVSRIPITKEYGISEEEFSKVAYELYEERESLIDSDLDDEGYNEEF